MAEMPDGRRISVDSDEFQAELSHTRSVEVEFRLGSFLIVAERRQRGGRYWVARGYQAGKRASLYLGTSFRSSEVRSAADELASRLSSDVGSPDPRAIDVVVRDLLRRERDPARREAAEAIAALALSQLRDGKA
jgi:hypothetical protein